MATRFFTNTAENTLLNKFKGVFGSNKDIECFDALIGFLRASGYFSIRPFLQSVLKIRILVGINVDTIIADYNRHGLLFLPNPKQTLDEFKKDLQKDIQQAGYKKNIEDGIIQFVEDVASKKIEIRAHPSRRLHAKIYIFRPEGFNEHKAGAVITGSSNLTDAGLGTKETNSNYEFKVQQNNHEDVSRRFSVKYLMAVMNSTVAREFLRANRRSNIHLYPNDWKKLPIPDVPLEQQAPVVSLVDNILAAKRSNPEADIMALESDVDKLVTNLYELSKEDIVGGTS